MANGLSDPCPDDPSQPANMSLRAAAVPYRRTPQGVELLLVRTRNRRAWTFPKGHIEQGESSMQAARREAMEEAGASGRIEAEPFTRYRLPAWAGPGSRPSEVCVSAHLMEVEALDPHGSVERRAAWFRPRLAASKLAESRPTAYAREHRRVITEALARLQVPEPEP